MASLHERLADARRRFERAGIAADEAAIDAEVLARHVLGWDRAALLTHAHEPAAAAFDARFATLVERRVQREPVAYIVGHREFWGLDFDLTPDVLVPRPETEFVVEAALEAAGRGAVRHIVDVGTGSGCIAVALAVELPAVSIVATDTSRAALAVARRNAVRHGVADRIELLHANLLDSVTVSAELIVSNPPYVPAADLGRLAPEVSRYEPRGALVAGDDGLDAIRRLVAQAADRLAPDGRLVVEFGFGQASMVTAFAADAGWRIVAMCRDLQQIPRVVVLGR